MSYLPFLLYQGLIWPSAGWVGVFCPETDSLAGPRRAPGYVSAHSQLCLGFSLHVLSPCREPSASADGGRLRRPMGFKALLRPLWFVRLWGAFSVPWVRGVFGAPVAASIVAPSGSAFSSTFVCARLNVSFFYRARATVCAHGAQAMAMGQCKTNLVPTWRVVNP